MWDARGVEDAFDDSEENAATTTTTRLNSSAEDEYSVEKYSVEKDSAVLTASGTASETTEEADGANVSKETRFVTRDLVTRDLSSLREWTNELRAYQRAFAEDGVNDDAAEKKAGAFLREHLARADAVVDEIVKRRDALAKQTRDAMREGLSSDASMTILNGTAHDPNATLHTRKSRLLRKLQLFDAEAFAALSDVAEAQTRRFFEPLREVSGSMFARFLKSKFSGPGCSEDRAVDFAAIGRAGARLERRAGAGTSGRGSGSDACCASTRWARRARSAPPRNAKPPTRATMKRRVSRLIRTTACFAATAGNLFCRLTARGGRSSAWLVARDAR
jgi:hypothetical protein